MSENNLGPRPMPIQSPAHGPAGAPAARLTASHLTVAHLTDEQFTDLLLGAIPPAVIAHLASCPQCTEESQRVAGAIGSFAQQSRLWAERSTTAHSTTARSTTARRTTARRTASRPAHMPTRQAPFAWLGIPIPPIAWVAATLMLAAGLSLFHRAEHTASAPRQQVAVAARQGTAPATSATPIVTPASVAPATLKADNELLSAVDGELTGADSSGVQTSVQTYLTVGSHSARTHSAKGISN